MRTQDIWEVLDVETGARKLASRGTRVFAHHRMARLAVMYLWEVIRYGYKRGWIAHYEIGPIATYVCVKR